MTGNHKIKGVIFDLGNVILDFDHRIAAAKIAKFTDMSGEDIYNLFFDSPATGLFEEGKISPEDFFKIVKEKLGLKLNFEEFVPIWNEIFFFSEKNLAAYNIARLLKNNYRVALLSNINFLHLEYIKKTFPILDAFHDILASCELKLRKPDARIYLKALEVLGTQAAETFYTDDRPDLIEGARKLGINGYVFSSVDALKADLAGCNIN
ncbi:MAG: HAD family phosphatase [Candidatus Omnitrophica bacterium]|nr:HAD family phosphatase [Candidatus Omnitrophota bacterium]